jgi:hypothetical protein
MWLPSVLLFGQRARDRTCFADFSRELRTAVLWPNNSGLDIRWVRLRPYSLDPQTLIGIDQIILLSAPTRLEFKA